MTTVTIITGDLNSGRALVGTALAEYMGDTWVINPPNTAVTIPDEGSPRDLILISMSAVWEDWMQPWLEKFGQPMFHIHIKRIGINGKK